MEQLLLVPWGHHRIIIDNKTVGILVCKNKDNTLAKHIINGMGLPVGISEYQLSNLIPEKCKSALPTIDELEKPEK